MNDQYTEQYTEEHQQRQYVPPAVRIAAVYPASDGRVPESIDVEISTSVDIDPIVDAVTRIVAALARVPDNRLSYATGGPISGPGGGRTVDHVYLHSGGHMPPIRPVGEGRGADPSLSLLDETGPAKVEVTQ